LVRGTLTVQPRGEKRLHWIRGLLLVLAVGCAQVPSSRSEGMAGTMLSEAQSAKREAEQDQAKLDRLLAELGTMLSKDANAQLARVQQQWNLFVRLDCEWKRDLVGTGSAAPLVYAKCLQSHVDHRIDDLKLNLCEGGGIAY
jgi:uncharacterized protein YecT (DUF1311 family)